MSGDGKSIAQKKAMKEKAIRGFVQLKKLATQKKDPFKNGYFFRNVTKLAHYHTGIISEHQYGGSHRM
jgi:hypothetical protein